MNLSGNIFKTALILIILANELSQLETALVSECLIHSTAYKFEYLYSTNELENINSNKRNVFTYPLNNVDNFDKIRWKFIPVEGSNSTYYIKSQYYKEYLCAANSYKDIFKMRRKLYSIRVNEPQTLLDSPECKWSFDKINSKSQTSNNAYFIWNLMYQEPLYAISYFYKNHKLKRNVYLWYKKPNSKQFKWQVDCLSERFVLNY